MKLLKVEATARDAADAIVAAAKEHGATVLVVARDAGDADGGSTGGDEDGEVGWGADHLFAHFAWRFLACTDGLGSWCLPGPVATRLASIESTAWQVAQANYQHAAS